MAESNYKGKKIHPQTGHKDREGNQKYSSTLSLTSALNGNDWSTPRRGCFNPGKEILDGWMDGPQGRSGRVREVSPTLGFDPRNIHEANIA